MSVSLGSKTPCSTVMEASSANANLTLEQTSTVEELLTSHRALEIPEILTMILANTSCTDLQSGRRVCRFWYNAVGGAKSGAKILAQLRVARLTPPFGTLGMPRHSYEGRPLAHVHPLLVGQSFFASAWDSQIELTFPKLHILLALPAGGQWEHTFLTQPPCPRVKIEVAGDALGVKHDVKIENPNGVTLGQVVTTLKGAITLGSSASDYERAAARSVHVTGYVRGWVWSDSDVVKKAERFEASLKLSRNTHSDGRIRRMNSFTQAEARKKAKHDGMVAGAMRRLSTRMSSGAGTTHRVTRRSSTKKSR